MMVKPEYIVICQQIVGGDKSPIETVYNWDRRRFADRPAAINHGFKIRGSDDFNIGVVEGDKLVSFDWMDGPLEYPLAEVSKAIFLGVAR